MALSGSVTVAATNWDDLVFSWTAVQDKATKSSTVSWKMELVAKDFGQIIATPGSPWTVTIDGQEFSGTTDIAIGNNETKTLAEGEAVLQHESDGTRSFEFSFSQTFYITFGDQSIGVITGEGTGELDRIGFDIVSWLWGYLLALCGRPIRWPKGEPVGYLYGEYGQPLPAISPLWDEDKYPYLIIRAESMGPNSEGAINWFYNLCAYEKQPILYPVVESEIPYFRERRKLGFADNERSPSADYGGPYYDAVPYYWSKGLADADYTESTSAYVFFVSEKTGKVVWTNFDIYDTDGNLYFPKSADPTPVYE